MKMLTLPLMAVLLTGCATLQFEIKEADTRLMAGAERLIVSENNRISKKSIAGGVHIDSQGVFINPFVERLNSSNEIVKLGFVIINNTEFASSGSPNTLGVIEQLNCMINGANQVNLRTSNQQSSSTGPVSFNSIGRYATVGRTESAVALTSAEQFRLFATAQSMYCRVTGSRRTVLYEENDIDPQFVKNIRQFYEEKVK